MVFKSIQKLPLIYAKLCVTEQCANDKQPLCDLDDNIFIVSN